MTLAAILDGPRRALVFLAAFALLLAACTGGALEPSSRDAAAAWRTSTLTDVRTGASFRVADLTGKVVAIEPMAIWCSSCALQQREARDAIRELRSDDLVYISLDVDPGEQGSALAAYAEREGFEWTFAIARPDVSRSLAEEFGDLVLSPPSTPLIVLDPEGRVVVADFGHKGSNALVATLGQYLP